MGWGLSSLLSLQDHSLHSSQAPGNIESLISSGSRGQKPNSLRPNLLFTVHNCKFLSLQTCRTHLPFRPKYSTGQDTGDTFTCSALPNLLSQLNTPWRKLHFLPTKLWLTSPSTTVKTTVSEKQEFLHHQFFQESSFLFILQVTAAEHSKYQLSSWQFSKKTPTFLFPCWFINFTAQIEFFQMQHSLLLKDPFHLCPGDEVSPVYKCTCAFFKLSYKPKNLSGAETPRAINQRLSPTVLSPPSKFSVLQWKTSQESSCTSYLVTSPKWHLRWKKILPWKKAWFMRWNRQVSQGSLLLGSLFPGLLALWLY